MNKKIMKDIGFGKQIELVEALLCPICENSIDLSEFRDRLSMQEFDISGLCQKCQDEIFGE